MGRSIVLLLTGPTISPGLLRLFGPVNGCSPPRCRPAASAANAAYQQCGAAASAECACSPGDSTTDGRETKHAGQSGCCLEVSPPQRFTDVVELAGIAERKIRRPAVVLLDELDVDLCRVRALTNKLGMTPRVHCLLRKKSCNHQNGIDDQQILKPTPREVFRIASRGLGTSRRCPRIRSSPFVTPFLGRTVAVSGARSASA